MTNTFNSGTWVAVAIMAKKPSINSIPNRSIKEIDFRPERNMNYYIAIQSFGHTRIYYLIGIDKTQYHRVNSIKISKLLNSCFNMDDIKNKVPFMQELDMGSLSDESGTKELNVIKVALNGENLVKAWW